MSVVDELTIGVDIKRCSECEYKKGSSLRDDLLVTAGARAAYMHDKGLIDLPAGVDGEHKLADHITQLVDTYLVLTDINFDLYIEYELKKEYSKGE